jgi:hypothetical protein
MPVTLLGDAVAENVEFTGELQRVRTERSGVV